MNAAEVILDQFAAHQVNLQGLSNGIVKRIVGLLADAEADVVNQLSGLDLETLGAQRLQSLLGALRETNAQAARIIEGALAAEMTDLAAYEAAYSARTIKAAIPLAIDVIAPSRQILVAAVMARPFQGRLLREWVDGLSDAATVRLRDAIRMGVVEGQTIDQIVRRIRGTRANGYKDGILEITRRGAEAMTRTAVNHTTTYARELVYKDNPDLVKGVKWVSTLDSRTSEICMSLDGKVFPVGEGQRPPAHINCRSTTAPVLASWRDLGFDKDELNAGTRASMNGQVPSDLNYSQWLRRQPRSIVEEALGPTKAKLFLEGGLSIERFVNNGKALTLDELKRRDAAAFERAGLA